MSTQELESKPSEETTQENQPVENVNPESTGTQESEKQPEETPPAEKKEEKLALPTFTLSIRTSLLHSLANYAAQFIAEPTFTVKRGEQLGMIGLTAMDPSHVMLIDTGFDAQRVEVEGKFAVDLADLAKILPRKAADDVILSIDGVNPVLNVQIHRQKFTLPLLQPSTTDAPIPKLTYAASITVSRKALYNALSQAAKITQQVRLIATSEELRIESFGDGVNFSAIFNRKDHDVYEITYNAEKPEQKAMYGLSFLKDMIASGGVWPFDQAPIVRLDFSEDKPARIRLDSAPITVWTYLAPRLE